MTIHGVKSYPMNETLLTSFELALHDKAASTRALYLDVVRRFAQALPEGVSLLAVRRQDAEGYFAQLRDEGRAPTTIRSRWIALRNFYGWLAEEEEIAENPMARVKVAKPEPGSTPMPEPEALTKLFKSLAGKGFLERRDLAMIRLAAATGLRVGELCALKVVDVDLRNRIATVHHGKGDKYRLVAFDGGTGAVLDRYLRARSRERLAHLPALWLSRFGAFGVKGTQAMLARRCVDAAIPHVHWHQLRHLFAHQFLARGGQEGDLARLGGWSDPGVMRRYGNVAATDRALANYRDMGGVLD